MYAHFLFFVEIKYWAFYLVDGNSCLFNAFFLYVILEYQAINLLLLHGWSFVLHIVDIFSVYGRKKESEWTE